MVITKSLGTVGGYSSSIKVTEAALAVKLSVLRQFVQTCLPFKLTFLMEHFHLAPSA